ncbi:hypothetical protein BJV77DRAFT_993057, partial [Russula vinacea]
MFKRVDRRRKRKENEERLGFDEEVFGLYQLTLPNPNPNHPTLPPHPPPQTAQYTIRKKRKRGSSPPSYDKSGEDEDGEPAIDDEEDEEGSIDRGTHPSLTIASALKEPIRLILPDSEVWVCVFCPGKTLKHEAMVKVHEASRIHRGRFKRMQELAMEFSPEEDIENVLAKSTTEAQPKADGAILSRRAEKRKTKQAKLKERRKRFKEKKAAAMAMANARRLLGKRDVHRTSLRGEARKILVKEGRRNRKETIKSPVPRKSKK